MPRWHLSQQLILLLVAFCCTRDRFAGVTPYDRDNLGPREIDSGDGDEQRRTGLVGIDGLVQERPGDLPNEMSRRRPSTVGGAGEPAFTSAAVAS